MQLVYMKTEGHLPTSTFVLVDERGTEVGMCQLRHKPSCRKGLNPTFANHVGYEIYEPLRRRGYGTTLLALAKIEAKAIGLSISL